MNHEDLLKDNERLRRRVAELEAIHLQPASLDKALRESEDRYRTVVDHLPHKIFLKDVDSVYVLCNEPYARDLGIAAADIVGKTDFDFFPRELAEKYRADDWRVMKLARVEEIEEEYLDQGESRTVLTVKTPLLDEQGNVYGVLGIFTDVTERKKVGEALREREMILTSILAASPVGILLTQDGRIKWANSAWKEMLGYAIDDEYLDQPTRIMFPSEEDYVRVREILYADLKPREVSECEVSLKRKDCTLLDSLIRIKLVDASDPSKGRISAISDISERRKAELRLRQSEEMFRSLFETAGDSIYLLDADGERAGRIMLANPAAAQMHGYTVDELLSMKISDLDSPESAARVPERLDQLLRGEMLRDEGTHQTKDGSVFPIEIVASLVELGGHKYIMAIDRDITDRKRSEEELREISAHRDALLAAIPDIIMEVDATKTYTWSNQAGLDFFGEDVIGKEAAHFFDGEQDTYELVEPLFSGQEDVIYVRSWQRRTDGQKRLLAWWCRVLRDAAGNITGAISSARDITDTVRAEEQIRLNEERLQSLYDISQYEAESIQDLLNFSLHEAVKLAESKVGYIYLIHNETELFELNARSQGVTWHGGVTEPQIRYELDKTGFWDEAVRKRKPIVVNDFQADNAMKNRYTVGHVQLHNFMTVPVFEGNKIVAVVGVANKDSDYNESDVRQLTLLMDSVWRIASAKRSELAQRRSATALEHAAEGVIITDKDGTIQYVNPSLARMTGYSREELLGKNPRIFKSGEQDAAFYEQLWRTIRGGGIWTGRFINKRKDGTFYTEDSTISPVKDASEKITGFVGMKRDITEHLALSRQLVHAQKMEAVGTLAGGMAHDFNNILQAILGYSDLILMKKGTGDPDRKKLEVIQQAARDGADLVSRILTFSRKAESKRRPVDLNEEILKAQKLLRRTIPRMIDIRLALEENLKIIDADPAQVEQVLLNLAINAHHAMPDGGQLLIETRNGSLSDDYLLWAHLGAQAGRYVLLTVSDTGIGMDPSLQDRIFEPFFTTKTNGEGTGLGLSMVHGIVSQHGGYIRCYSEPGKGTSFKIYLPVSARDLDSDLALTREMPAFGTETILLVDDDDRIRAMGKQMIEMGGYKVVIAKSGEEALGIYSSHKEEIALIILDLIMPGMGGSRCLGELLHMDPNVKVLVASGYSPNGQAKEQESSGARGFVSKPYDAKDILTAIREVLDKGTL